MNSSDLSNWKPVQYPESDFLTGNYCNLVKLSTEKHAESLFREFQNDENSSMWEYLPYGPFYSLSTFIEFINEYSIKTDPKFFAIVDKRNDDAIGFSSYLRIDQSVGVIEIGHLAFSPRLQKTRIATEAIYLLIKYALSLGYRRIEWKCNNKNLPSMRAAERFGFKFEGVFRQATIVKGKNRDTAWYSIIDIESDKILSSFEDWLSPSNFDSELKQENNLSYFMTKLDVKPHELSNNHHS